MTFSSDNEFSGRDWTLATKLTSGALAAHSDDQQEALVDQFLETYQRDQGELAAAQLAFTLCWQTHGISRVAQLLTMSIGPATTEFLMRTSTNPTAPLVTQAILNHLDASEVEGDIAQYVIPPIFSHINDALEGDIRKIVPEMTSALVYAADLTAQSITRARTYRLPGPALLVLDALVEHITDPNATEFASPL